MNVCVCEHNRVDKTLGKILRLESRNYFYCNCAERKFLLLWKILKYHFFFFLLSRDLGTILTMHVSLAVAFPLSHSPETKCHIIELLSLAFSQHDTFFLTSEMVSVSQGSTCLCSLSVSL